MDQEPKRYTGVNVLLLMYNDADSSGSGMIYSTAGRAKSFQNRLGSGSGEAAANEAFAETGQCTCGSRLHRDGAQCWPQDTPLIGTRRTACWLVPKISGRKHC
jgi:hypothetical protein